MGEGIASDKGQNVLFVDFPWAELDRDDSEVSKEVAPDEIAKISEGVKAILLWLFKGRLKDQRMTEKKRSEGVKIRAYALAWILFPEIFEERTEEALAKAIEKDQPALARAIADLLRTFQFKTARSSAGK